MSTKLKSVPPNTRRLIEGFRDTGYTFNASIADIVDNSIAAGAENVSVYVGWMGDDPFVWVADDGSGMNEDQLENAMRYGSDRRDDPHSLGRFGLGLKTASTSFCKKLTVISRAEGAPSFRAHWDLDVVAEHNDWVLEIGEADADDWDHVLEGLEPAGLDDVPHGTLVRWDKVDRLLRTKAGRTAKNKGLIMDRLCENLEWHLRTVYQRFLDPDGSRARILNIFLNDQALIAWDPFCSKIGGEEVATKHWTLQDPSGANHDVLLRAFILPRPEEFETEADRKYARISNDRQGIYLYREDRLIEGPDWLGLGASDTHWNNLRVELSFPGPVDEVFGVGIKKSGVHLDAGLLNELNSVLAPVKREANVRSRKGSAKVQAAKSTSGRPSENTIARTMKSLTLPELKKSAEGSTVLTNNTGDIAVTDSAGKSTGALRILVNEETDSVSVVRRESLEDGTLWMPALGAGRSQVAVNTSHDWYRKAYVANSTNSPLVQAIEFLLYALAMAELNNTNSDRVDMFEEFRIEVSRNLRKLVKDLPEPDDGI